MARRPWMSWRKVGCSARSAVNAVSAIPRVGVEATSGFEPLNRGFADLRVEPLHHVASGAVGFCHTSPTRPEGPPRSALGRPGIRAEAVWLLVAPRGFEPRL